jgi:hypothetical protein
VQDFGELIMNFASLANDDTTSDLVIKPEYYITVSEQAVCDYSSYQCTMLHSACSVYTKVYLIDLLHEVL